MHFFFFRGHTCACGSSQARGGIRAAAAGLHHSQILDSSVAYTTVHSNAGSFNSLTKAMSSWILVGTVTPQPQDFPCNNAFFILISQIQCFSAVQHCDPVTSTCIH